MIPFICIKCSVGNVHTDRKKNQWLPKGEGRRNREGWENGSRFHFTLG